MRLPRPTPAQSRAARVAVLVLVLALAAVAVADQWDRVRPSLARLSAGSLLLSFLAGCAAVACAVPAWRSLLREVGGRLPGAAAARVFLLGQLGKFVPGSVWVVVAQTELGRRYGVPRRASATAGLLTMGVSLATALVTAAAFLPLGSAQLRRDYGWLSLVAVAALAGLAPRVLTPVVGFALRLLRREPLPAPLTWRGMGAAAGWSLAGWLLYGVHAWLLARGLGGSGALLLPRSVGAFALAWSAGFLVVVAPAGAGVREAALVAGFSPVLPPGAPLALALVSRLLLTLADVTGGGVAALLGRTRGAAGRPTRGAAVGDATRPQRRRAGWRPDPPDGDGRWVLPPTRRCPMSRNRLPLLVVLLLSTLLPALLPASAKARARPRSRAVCTRPHAGFAHCDAVARVDAGGRPLVTGAPAGLTPADLQGAYGLPATGGGLVAVVDAYDDPRAEADLAVWRATFGQPPCAVADGCLTVVGGDGSPRLPVPNDGWAEETSLDLDAVSAVCPGCRLLLVEARSSALADLLAAERTAVAWPGVVAVSNSWGGAEPPAAARAVASEAFRSDHVRVTVSSGDSGYGVEFPASSPEVVAVGGTTLVVGPGHRRVSETVWSGSGSGCSAGLARPAWQPAGPCRTRAVADAAAVADPATGLSVRDTYGVRGGGWLVVGGTSLAAPVVAGIHALAGTADPTARSLYAPGAAVFDVTSGGNGRCRPAVRCTAGPGWDGPTGVGAPAGVAGW